MRFTILLAIFFLFSCQNKNQSDGETVSSKALPKAEVPMETNPEEQNAVDTIGDSEVILVTQKPLGLRTLEDFEVNGSGRTTKTNDSLFVEFLKSFTTYQNSANDILYDHPKYETWNTLAYSDDDIIKSEALDFQDSVKLIGFTIGMTEGSIFLEKDPEFLNRFSQYLSKRMNSFKAQYNLENEQPLAEDGGLAITINEHIKRILFWEIFGNDHPDFELPEYANNQFEIYIFYLMFGMDNTPIHDWSDEMNVRTEMIDTYRSVISTYPNSRAAELLGDYLKYLEEKGFKYDRSFDEYGRRNFPSMYGN
jgi:hypothetical protein